MEDDSPDPPDSEMIMSTQLALSIGQWIHTCELRLSGDTDAEASVMHKSGNAW